jgi:hypothetical protein
MACVNESLIRLNQALDILNSKRENVISLSNSSQFNDQVGNVVLMLDNLSNAVNYKFSRIITKSGKDVIFTFPSLCNQINKLTGIISDSYVNLNDNVDQEKISEVEKTLTVLKKIEKLIVAYTEIYSSLEENPCQFVDKKNKVITLLNNLNDKLKKYNTYVFYTL